MKKICLQPGHVNIKNNVDPALRGSTGAANEVQFNSDIANRVAKELIRHGMEVTITDANANSDDAITSVDWDLYLAIHFDADIYNDSGGFVDFADPASDQATAESQRIAKILAEQYFSFTGIKEVSKRSNANTRFYYMWRQLSAKTPCVLIECGVGNRKPKDYEPLFTNRDLVTEGIVRGICKAFGVAYKPNTESLLESQIEALQIKLEAVEKDLDEMRVSRNTWRDEAKAAKKEIERITEEKDAHILELENALAGQKEEVERLKRVIETTKTPLSEYTIKERLASIVSELTGRG